MFYRKNKKKTKHVQLCIYMHFIYLRLTAVNTHICECWCMVLSYESWTRNSAIANKLHSASCNRYSRWIWQ